MAFSCMWEPIMQTTKRAMKSQLTPETLKGRLMLRVQEYAELTGTPAPSVYRYVALGMLPSIRIGNTLRIPVSALTDQLKGESNAE